MSDFKGIIYMEFPHDDETCGVSEVNLKSASIEDAELELEEHILDNYSDSEQNIIIKTDVIHKDYEEPEEEEEFAMFEDFEFEESEKEMEGDFIDLLEDEDMDLDDFNEED